MRAGRKPKTWAYTALRNPDRLVAEAESLPESIRDVPTLRKKLVKGLIEEHGGPACISIKEALLIDRIGRLWPYLELCDRGTFDKGDSMARPRDYSAMHNALTRSIQALAKIANEKRSANNSPLDLTAYLKNKEQK